MTVDKTIFFVAVRKSLFDGRLRQRQVDGLVAMIDRWEETRPRADRRWLAYALATAHHETGRTMQPVRETFAATDDQAIGILDAAFRRGNLPSVSTPYWRRDGDGKSWLGRGLVQLTHRRNYETMSRATGIDIVAEPQRAMEMAVAVDILFCGMEAGSFTGRAFHHHFGPGRHDWTGARRIINGRDKAALVASYGRAYLTALDAAGMNAAA